MIHINLIIKSLSCISQVYLLQSLFHSSIKVEKKIGTIQLEKKKSENKIL